ILIVNKNREMVSFNQRFVVMWELSSNIVDTSSDEIAINSVLDKLVDPEEFVSRVNYLYEHPDLKSREEVLLKDGRVFDRHSSAMLSSDREYLGRIWFFRDITEQKQAEEALKKAKEDLEKKNEEMEAFIYTAAHDLRTPLISVRGFLNLMKKELVGKLDEKSEYHLERVMKNAAHFDNLLGDLLQFSQVGIDTGQREEINLSTVAREITYEIARSYDIEASLVISEKLSIVNMQSSRVYQLFENLITNSVKFKRSGIPLELEIGVGFPDDDMPEGHVPVYVRDNGVGIEEDIQGEIFGLFSRPVANSEEGTGVGLAIVKRIVEEEGGSIRVESTPGEGTTFYFSLPVVSTSS
ncbi:MAG: ATP-binding protein, partial [bacterium]